MTFVALANITLGSSASSVTFSSIPATFRDLVLVFSGTATNTADWFIRLNGATSDYSGIFMLGNGSSASSGTTGTGEIALGLLNSTVANATVQLMDYSATDKHKTTLVRQNNSSYTIAIAHRWANTAAVNSIVAGVQSGFSFATGTSLALYGIAS